MCRVVRITSGESIVLSMRKYATGLAGDRRRRGVLGAGGAPLRDDGLHIFEAGRSHAARYSAEVGAW